MSSAEGPLKGYRVLELGSTVAGPFCGRLFADFGAEVIKVEPLEGDVIRSIGARYQGKSLYASSIFRNKSLIAVDLRTHEGQDIARKIAARSDFVIENFKPGTLEKWRLGYSDLRALNPRIIMVRISGYGQTGPYSKRPGYGIICEAVGGLRHLTGDPDRPPARVAVSLTDCVTGLYAFSGALLALTHLAKTGEGQCVDAALYESAFSLMEQHIAGYQKLGIIPNRMGAGTGSAPNNLYHSADGQWIHIAANGSAVFKRLMHTMGRSDPMKIVIFDSSAMSMTALLGGHVDVVAARTLKLAAYASLQSAHRSGCAASSRAFPPGRNRASTRCSIIGAA